MKRIQLFIFALLMASFVANANTGWFSDYVKLNVNAGGEASYWIGTDPSFGTQLDGAALGNVSSLVITGCDMKYWSDTQDRLGGAFYYKVTNDAGTEDFIAPTEIIWDQTGPTGNDYQGTKTISIDLLASLPFGSGSYKLHVWSKHWGTGQGDNYLNNGGPNYVATFSKAATTSMSGVYKVGTASGYNFNSLVAATTALNAATITGDVVLEITSDLLETASARIGANTGIYSVTIRPDADVDRKIELNMATDNAKASGVIIVGMTADSWENLTSNTQNIIIDGYAVGGTTRRLTLATTDAANIYHGPIQIVGDSKYITVKNCILTQLCAVKGSTTYAVRIRVEKNAAATAFIPSDITIENNVITAVKNTAQMAIGLTAATGLITQTIKRVVIKNNEIYARTRGVSMSNNEDIVISGNAFSTEQTSPGMLSSWIQGINYAAGTVTVSGNKFLSGLVANISAGDYGFKGIIASGGGTWYIENNFITGFKATGASGVTQMIAIRCGNTCFIRNNTFVLNALNANPNLTPTYQGILIAAGTPEIKNNILISNEDAVTNTLIVGTNGGDSDYNIMYLKAGNTNARINGAYATFAAYQTGTGKDANSKFIDVNFVSLTDLSLSGTSIDDADLAVPRLAAVTKDINGFDRWTNTHAGAHEPNMLKAYMKSEVTTGNWSDIGSWKMSDDNAAWVAATQVPTASATAISILKDHEITIDAAATASAVTINAGGKLTLNDGVTFNFTDHYGMNFVSDITIESNLTDGTGTYVDKNSTIGDNVSATVNQELSARSWYLSSPVESFWADMITEFVLTYRETSNVWNQGGVDNEMTAGKGYLVNPGTVTNIPFSGTLNNGDIDVTLTRSVANTDKPGFNLIGNPYPSYIDWTALYTANSISANMPTSTMWYRSKSSGAWDFHTVNGAGDVSVPVHVSKVIPPMQAFWVRTNSGGGTMNFTNAMRLHSNVSNLLKAPSAINERQLIRLQLSDETKTDEMVIYSHGKASNGFDKYDSPKMHGDLAIPEFYTSIGSEHLVINGMREIPLNTEIPLIFKAGNSTSFSITANEISNLDEGTKLILKDNITKYEADLTDGITKYEFTPVTNDASRFSVMLSKIISSTPTINKDENIQIFVNGNRSFTVRTKETPNATYSVMLFNSTGQLLNSQKMNSSVTVINHTLSSGLYIVKVAANGKTTTKKLIIN